MPIRYLCASNTRASLTKPYEARHAHLRFAGWLRGGRSGLRRWLRSFRWNRFSDGQILAHFVQAFLSKPANGQQIIDALEGAIRFTHLQDFLRRRRPDPGHLLELFRSRGINVHRLCRRLLFASVCCRRKEKEQPQRKEHPQSPRSPRHSLLLYSGKYSNQQRIGVTIAGCLARRRLRVRQRVRLVIRFARGRRPARSAGLRNRDIFLPSPANRRA